jgi:hypothetical protein
MARWTGPMARWTGPMARRTGKKARWTGKKARWTGPMAPDIRHARGSTGVPVIAIPRRRRLDAASRRRDVAHAGDRARVERGDGVEAAATAAWARRRRRARWRCTSRRSRSW